LGLLYPTLALITDLLPAIYEIKLWPDFYEESIFLSLTMESSFSFSFELTRYCFCSFISSSFSSCESSSSSRRNGERLFFAIDFGMLDVAF
jgi:hypothetical protein